MSKVVHLSNDAHAAAKAYCKENGLKMSDWVASLITKAICVVQEPAPEPIPAPVQALAPAQPMSIAAAVAEHQAAQAALAQEVEPASRKKRLARFDEEPLPDDGIPAYAKPPFWARTASTTEEADGSGESDGVSNEVEAKIPAKNSMLGELDL